MSKPTNWPLPADGVRFIVPPSILKTLERSAVCADLYPTAFGYYPHAENHRAERTHHDDNLLIYCVRGRGVLTLQNQNLEVQGGHLVVLEQDVAHRYQADPRDPWTIFWIHFTGSKAHDYLQRTDGSQVDPVTNVGVLAKAMSDFWALLDARHSTHQKAAFIHAANNLKQLICYFRLPRPLGEDADIVGNANTFMLERLTVGVTLDELADAVHLSKHHFARRFKYLTGTSPLTRFNQMRMNRACQLLDTTTMPVSAIASAIGFEDPYYFSRVFRRIIGLSPSAYRRAHRG